MSDGEHQKEAFQKLWTKIVSGHEFKIMWHEKYYPKQNHKHYYLYTLSCDKSRNTIVGIRDKSEYTGKEHITIFHNGKIEVKNQRETEGNGLLWSRQTPTPIDLREFLIVILQTSV